MISGLAICCWMAYCCALPWGQLCPMLTAFIQLSVVLCLGMRPCELSSFHDSMSISGDDVHILFRYVDEASLV